MAKKTKVKEEKIKHPDEQPKESGGCLPMIILIVSLGILGYALTVLF